MWNVALVAVIVALIALGAWVVGHLGPRPGRRDVPRTSIARMQRGVKRDARAGQRPAAMRSHSSADSARRNRG